MMVRPLVFVSLHISAGGSQLLYSPRYFYKFLISAGLFMLVITAFLQLSFDSSSSISSEIVAVTDRTFNIITN